MFRSGFRGRRWRETFAEVPRATTAASAVPANERDRARWVLRERWLLRRAEPCCPGLAGACLRDKGCGLFWVVFPLKPLCRLSKRREGCAALGWRVLPPPVRDGPVRCVPAHPWLWCWQRRLHLPGFCTAYARCGVRGGLVWFGLVFLEGRKERGGEKGGQLAPDPKSVPSPVGTRVFVGMPRTVIQTGRRTSRETKGELRRVRSLFVCVWFLTGVKSFVRCRCLICPRSRHYSFVENNTCIDWIAASPAENQCSVILQVSSVRVSPLTYSHRVVVGNVRHSYLHIQRQVPMPCPYCSCGIVAL